MKIVLIGFACCYKSSVGKLLAEKLNYKFVDTDKVIEEAAGRSVAEIFATEGEAGFRERERQTLLSLIDCDNAVIACGGGSALCPDFKLLVDKSTVVWLTATANTVKSRLGEVPRPLFDGKDVSEIEQIMKNRNDYYSKYANITVSTDDRSSQQVADVLFDRLK